MVYIWSDLHLGHTNVIKYENRPFSSTEEMNQTILDNWKKTVKKQDTIINLGDVAFGIDRDSLRDMITSMPGKKMLIIGNHDRGRSLTYWYDVGFDEVYKYPIIYDSFYILSHEPLYVNDSMPYVNIHGHIHSETITNPQKVNVSVECIEYVPILFNKIKDMYRGENE